jgi:hypothetical protein
MGGEYEPLRRRHSGRGCAVPVRCPSICSTRQPMVGVQREIANEVHKSGTSARRDRYRNARFVPSRRKLGSFFELGLLKK